MIAHKNQQTDASNNVGAASQRNAEKQAEETKL